jgi:hypothetical protein
VLAVLAGGLLLAFGGVTDRLIPLFAAGAFLAFTLPQAGMVMHWRRSGGPHAHPSMWINGLGALATAATTVVVMVSKFTEGAWVTVLLVPSIVVVMKNVHGHYERLIRAVTAKNPLPIEGLIAPLVVLPLDNWTRISQKVLRFASTTPDVIAVHVDSSEEPSGLVDAWPRLVEEPARRGVCPCRNSKSSSRLYRFVIGPPLEFILAVERSNPHRQIAVILPNLVESHWYHRFLHNQRAELLTALLPNSAE